MSDNKPVANYGFDDDNIGTVNIVKNKGNYYSQFNYFNSLQR